MSNINRGYAPGMDPSIWGPPLWTMIFDVCWNLEVKTVNGKCTSKQRRDVEIFFYSLKHVLPCRYCRDSYKKFLRSLSSHNRVGPPCGRGALRWAYNLKNLVNRKLHRSDYPTYEVIRRRMKTYSSCTSVTDVLDILFIFAVNFPPSPRDPAAAQKRNSMLLFVNSLPNILDLMSRDCSARGVVNHGLRHEASVLRRNPLKPDHVASRKNLFEYLCARATEFDGQVRKPDELYQKYCACRTQKKKGSRVK